MTVARRAGLSIRQRLALGFGAIAAILAASVGLTLWRTYAVVQTVEVMIEQRLPLATVGARISNDVQTATATLNRYLLTGSISDRLRLGGVLRALAEDRDQFTYLVAASGDAELERRWPAAAAALRQFEEAERRAGALAHTPDATPGVRDVVQQVNRFVTTLTAMTKAIEELVDGFGTSISQDMMNSLYAIRDMAPASLAELWSFLLTLDEAHLVNLNRQFRQVNVPFGQLVVSGKIDDVYLSMIAGMLDIVEATGASMARVRASAQWNLPVAMVRTEVAPLADAVLDELDGPRDEHDNRAGGLTAQQAQHMRGHAELIEQSIESLRSLLIWLLVAGVAAAILIAWVTARSIAGPLGGMVQAMRRLAAGDTTIDLPGQARRDEIGAMAAAVQVFKDTAIEADRLAAETEERRAEQEQLREEREQERAQREQREREQMDQQISAAEELAGLIQAAVDGDLRRRMEMAEREGLLLSLAQGANRLLETIERGLSETIDVLGAMADGDLTQRVHGDYAGAFELLKDGTNGTAERLVATLARIVSIASALRQAADGLTADANDLAGRTDEQAQALARSAAALEQISTSVAHNARTAADVSGLATETGQHAQRGGEVVRSAIEAMGRIEESSNRVVEIIGVVEQIAFQTNLLALNAAVEAARAGAAGKGFAVVAGEVRSLAQRVTQASKEINALVADAVTNVKLGSELVHKSGEVLDQTAESFGRVARLVDQIADSTSQQASGLRDVTGAVSELDRTTQQQLEMAEQGFGTARSLLAQADQLVAEVGYFKTKTPAAAAAPSAVPAPEAPASKPLPRTAAKPASPSLASKQAPTKPARAAPAPPMRRSLPGSAKG